MSELGHNNPPPVVSHGMHIDDLYQEAHNWLDGQPIESQEQAEALGSLLTRFREARKGADEQRAVEKKPHDDAAKAVQANWKPLVDKCERAEKIAKNAIGTWQLKLEAEQRAAAADAARKADEERAAAQEALRLASSSERLGDAEEAEAALKRAKDAETAAARADKAKPLVATGGRSVGLRSYWEPELVDSVEALKHYRAVRPEELKAFLLEQAQRDVRAGARSIPGFTITEERKAA
jgi:hypothetical protein